MKVKKEELVLENSSPNVGTEHEEINSLGQTKWESDLWPFEGPKKWKKSARGAYKSIASILFTRVKFTCVRT